MITFDPFDKMKETATLVSFPFLVTDVDGPVNFTVNHKFPACSTANQFNMKSDPNAPPIACPPSDSNVRMDRFRACIDPSAREIKEVPSIRLSSFLKNQNIRKIDTIKIDAQGSDFQIIRDVFERSPEVEIANLRAECQMYDEAGLSRQLYNTKNDCAERI